MTDQVSPEEYIFAQRENRELATITRLICSPGSLVRHQFGNQLSWSFPYVWLGLRLPQKRLIRGLKHSPDKFNGDVDVCGGSLQPVSQKEYDRCYEFQLEETRRYIESLPKDSPKQSRREAPEQAINNFASQMILDEGKIKWPPDLIQIAAIEVKSAWYSAENELKAAGDRREGRKQALVLCRMGFDRVALARYVVTEPTVSDYHHPWRLASAHSAQAGAEYLNDELKGILVEETDPFGTIMIEVGSVAGKLEDMAGTESWKWLRPVPENPYRAGAEDTRLAAAETLTAVMSRHPVPTTFPVLILACRDDKCGNIYVGGVDPAALCPNCGGLPRSAPY